MKTKTYKLRDVSSSYEAETEEEKEEKSSKEEEVDLETEEIKPEVATNPCPFLHFYKPRSEERRVGKECRL